MTAIRLANFSQLVLSVAGAMMLSSLCLAAALAPSAVTLAARA